MEQSGNEAASFTVDVSGMTCGHCERAVAQAVKALDPQAEVKVDRANGKVQVRTTQQRSAVAAAITEEGYTAV